MTPWEDQQKPDRGKLYSFFIKYITRGTWEGEEELKDERRSQKHIRLWQSKDLMWTPDFKQNNFQSQKLCSD